ncbi:MAG: 50S ribosomal protein L21 [Chloroflexi bacterium]|nr:50S ribosomal protein L21 [Chloroflexota bacterium]
MTDYAIVRTGGKQYRVRPGDTVSIEKLGGEVGDFVNFDEILMTSVDDKVTVGSPLVENATVRAEITDQGRGKKVIAFRYKNKTRQRTKRGHRQSYTDVLVQDISIK